MTNNRRLRAPGRPALLAAAVLLTLGGNAAHTTAHAAACTWLPNSGDWTLAANWSCGSVPMWQQDAAVGAGKTTRIITNNNSGQAVATLANAGTVKLDAGALYLSSGTSTNTGSIRVGDGTQASRLVVWGDLNNTGGTINVQNNAVMQQEGTVLTGGVINTTGTGVVRISSSTPMWDGVTLNGRAEWGQGSSRTLAVRNGFTLNGSADIGFFGGMIVQDGQTLGGTGTIRLAPGTATMSFEGTGVTTLGSGMLISGQGRISGNTGDANGNRIRNEGRIEADGTELVLNTHLIGTSTGVLSATAGSSLVQNRSTWSGVINIEGPGTVIATGYSNVLDTVTLNGTLAISSGAYESVRNGLTVNGRIDMSGGGGSLIIEPGTQTLTGTGTILMGSGRASTIYLDGDGRTTVAAPLTIKGQGSIGGSYNVSGTHDLVNSGTLHASGGTLYLNTDVTGTSTGRFIADAGSVLLQNGHVLSGTLNTSGAGIVGANASTDNFLDGVTLNGNFSVGAGGSRGYERVRNGLTVNGVLSVNGTGGSALGINGGTQTLGGTGTIQLNHATARLTLEDGGTTTIAAPLTVQGQGSIGGTAFIGVGGSLVNEGTIRAQGGTLTLMSDVTGAASGRFVADANSVLLQSGVTLRGTINASGAGLVGANAYTTNFLDGVTLNGNFVVGTDGIRGYERVQNGLTVNGVLSVNGTSGSALGVNGGTQTLGGTGTIQLNHATARLTLEDAGTTTIAAPLTVQGQGSIGGTVFIGAPGSLVNEGTIRAQGGTLYLSSIASLTNHGLLHASNSSTLAVQEALQGTGTLQVDAGGRATLANAVGHTQGTLAMGAAGAQLALGDSNLTLTRDYTNAAAGSGNSFDRRAGVTGTGQILAGGDVRQVITGTGVSNGATNNATLTIGNVRVGANTYDVQIGNAGTTGPTLRGALQTAVNGGNVTDARLSGSGVTAGNYNAGGPGGNSGNLAVVFTAANAGALAPLAGQAINLRSTYENIADQKLNIVLGNGAAAYNAAQGSAGNSVVVANQRVGGSNSSAITVANTAAAGAYSEDLNAAITGTSGAARASGSISGRTAGSSTSGAGSITAGVDTSVAGARSGTVTLGYQTAGAVAGASNGLGTMNVGTQVVNVSGNVYQAASGALVGNTLNFGTVQVGQSISQNLAVRNTAIGAAGFVEDLHAGFGAATDARISGSGALAGIRAGATSNAGNGSMVVSVNTGSAGVVNGSIAVNYTSAGAVNGVGNGLGLLAVGSENFGVAGTIQAQANVVNQASPVLGTTTVNLGAVRVGAAAPTAALAITNQATAAPQAALNATLTSNGAPVTASGSVTLLAPGATDSSSLRVGLNTAVAGVHHGTATLALVSDASNIGNCGSNCALTLAPQTIAVNGKVYNTAQGQLQSPTVIDFGIVRVGDTPSARDIVVRNAATATALDDTLRASASGLSGPLAVAGSVGGIGAQQTGTLAVTLDTSAAGAANQTARVGFASHNADMADVQAGADALVQVKAQVNHLANADFDLLVGNALLTQSGSDYVLDLGRFSLGGSGTWELQLDNDIAGFADDLRGAFDMTAADDFGYGGFGSIGTLHAGDARRGLTISFVANAAGSYADTVWFDGSSFNASDADGRAQRRRLIVRAMVDGGNGNAVPEPSTLALLAGALVVGLRRRAAAAVRARGQA